MKWLRFPPTTPETIALLLASALKDTVALQWDGVNNDKCLRDRICQGIAKRYGQGGGPGGGCGGSRKS